MTIDIDSIRLTEHFTLRECIFGTDDCLLEELGAEAEIFKQMVDDELTQEHIENLRITCMEHENIRAICGNYPAIVLCGFRPLAWDRYRGRTYISAHTEGKALDTRHSRMPLENYYHVVDNSYAIGGRAINKAMNFVHKDWKFSKVQLKRTWSY